MMIFLQRSHPNNFEQLVALVNDKCITYDTDITESKSNPVALSETVFFSALTEVEKYQLTTVNTSKVIFLIIVAKIVIKNRQIIFFMMRLSDFCVKA